MTRTVALTGATGFIGWHVACRFLQEGWQVRALVRPGSDRPVPQGVDRMRAALDDDTSVRAACAGAAVVVHLAGLVRARSADAFTRVNVDGTRAVARAAQAVGARLVHTSSLGVTGPADPANPPSEDDPARPVNAYGESKRAAEQVVREEDGLEWTILRPTLVYGPRDRLFLPVFRLARLGLFPIPQPRAVYNLVHVADVARAISHAATSPRAVGQVFFVGHPRATAADHMLHAVSAALGKRYRPFIIPHAVLGVAASVGTLLGRVGLPVPLDRARLAEIDAPGFVCRVDKARAVLGFEASVELGEGMRQTAEWYRAEGWI